MHDRDAPTRRRPSGLDQHRALHLARGAHIRRIPLNSGPGKTRIRTREQGSNMPTPVDEHTRMRAIAHRRGNDACPRTPIIRHARIKPAWPNRHKLVTHDDIGGQRARQHPRIHSAQPLHTKELQVIARPIRHRIEDQVDPRGAIHGAPECHRNGVTAIDHHPRADKRTRGGASRPDHRRLRNKPEKTRLRKRRSVDNQAISQRAKCRPRPREQQPRRRPRNR